jgi:hypothetical protein
MSCAVRAFFLPRRRRLAVVDVDAYRCRTARHFLVKTFVKRLQSVRLRRRKSRRRRDVVAVAVEVEVAVEVVGEVEVAVDLEAVSALLGKRHVNTKSHLRVVATRHTHSVAPLLRRPAMMRKAMRTTMRTAIARSHLVTIAISRRAGS